MNDTDADLAEFSGQRLHPGPSGCLVGRALTDDLSDEDARKLRKALATPRIRHAQIERWLRDRGVRPYVGVVARHRRRACRCEDHGYV